MVCWVPNGLKVVPNVTSKFLTSCYIGDQWLAYRQGWWRRCCRCRWSWDWKNVELRRKNSLLAPLTLSQGCSLVYMSFLANLINSSTVGGSCKYFSFRQLAAGFDSGFGSWRRYKSFQSCIATKHLWQFLRISFSDELFLFPPFKGVHISWTLLTSLKQVPQFCSVISKIKPFWQEQKQLLRNMMSRFCPMQNKTPGFTFQVVPVAPSLGPLKFWLHASLEEPVHQHFLHDLPPKLWVIS